MEILENTVEGTLESMAPHPNQFTFTIVYIYEVRKVYLVAIMKAPEVTCIRIILVFFTSDTSNI
jgi:hypothetical protein